ALQLSIRGSNGVGSGYSSDQLLIRSIDLVNQTLSITLLFHRRNSELMLKRFNHGSVRALQPQRARARAVKPVNVPVLRHGALFNIRDESEGAARKPFIRTAPSPGALAVSQRSPFACWFSSMLYCFGGAVLSALMMADAPVAPLSNTTNLMLASLMWYLVFYCPQDAVYSLASILPLRLVLTAMKEVTRTWKVLVRGVWKPETNELLKMSYPTKVTLLGAVAFSLQQCRWIPVETPQLMLLYTLFLVTNKRSKPEPELSRWPNGAQDSDGGGSLQEKLVSAGTASDGPAQRRVPARTRSARAKDSPALSAEFVS
ncbi:hypothetical protein DNTS_009429, partial [Danionella cerebrum]